jgi:hypothetical protein
MTRRNRLASMFSRIFLKGQKKQGSLDGSVCVEEMESHEYVC